MLSVPREGWWASGWGGKAGLCAPARGRPSQASRDRTSVSRLPAAVQCSSSHGGTGALRQLRRGPCTRPGGLRSADQGADSKANGLRYPERQLCLPDFRSLAAQTMQTSLPEQDRCAAVSSKSTAAESVLFSPCVCRGEQAVDVRLWGSPYSFRPEGMASAGS